MPLKITPEFIPEFMTIAVENIKVQSYIGVLPEEKKKINFFTVSVYVSLNHFEVLKSGLLPDTIDYSEIYNFVIDEMSVPCDLIEEKIKSISVWLFNKYDTIDSIRLKISKLSPLYMEKCDAASIEVLLSKKKN